MAGCKIKRSFCYIFLFFKSMSKSIKCTNCVSTNDNNKIVLNKININDVMKAKITFNRDISFISFSKVENLIVKYEIKVGENENGNEQSSVSKNKITFNNEIGKIMGNGIQKISIETTDKTLSIMLNGEFVQIKQPKYKVQDTINNRILHAIRKHQPLTKQLPLNKVKLIKTNVVQHTLSEITPLPLPPPNEIIPEQNIKVLEIETPIPPTPIMQNITMPTELFIVFPITPNMNVNYDELQNFIEKMDATQNIIINATGKNIANINGNITIIESASLSSLCYPIESAFNFIEQFAKTLSQTFILFYHPIQTFKIKSIKKYIERCINEKNTIHSFGGYVYSGANDLSSSFVSKNGGLVNYLSLNGLMFNANFLTTINIDRKYEPFFGLENDLTEQFRKMGAKILVDNDDDDIQEFAQNGNIMRASRILINKWNINRINPINYDYINTLNFNKADKKFEQFGYNFPELKQITNKLNNNTNVYLVCADLGYPPFGGGENWLIDTMKWMKKRGFVSIMICFADAIKKTNFDKLNIVDDDDMFFIQYPRTMLNYNFIKLIKQLQPKCVSHQGSSREFYANLFNSLQIPFISGFCFWNDVIEFTNKFNINMTESHLTPNDKFKHIVSKCSYVYSCSTFMNDIIKKVHGIQLDVIETISNEEHYKINPEICEGKYVTMINVHHLKNGWIAKHLIEHLDKKIPLLMICTEPDGNEKMLKNMMIARGGQNIFIETKTINMLDIYKNTKILLVGSIVDETFCKVAYEGMMNKIPILSTNCGNLKYLLDGYANFMSKDDVDDWKVHIEYIYHNDEYLKMMRERVPFNAIGNAEGKFCDVVEKLSKHVIVQKNNHNVGIFAPWSDQGLGIQAREYYLQLVKQNYTPHIMAFKPYFATESSIDEWNYPNVHYVDKTREKVAIDDIVKFIADTKITTMIFIEICYLPTFEIVAMFKELNVKCIAIPNIETIRYDEIKYHCYFDAIMCNNFMTLDLLKRLGMKNVFYMGFEIKHPFFNTIKPPYNDSLTRNNIISFFISGGMNSIVRKHIKTVGDTFNLLKYETTKHRIVLYVYIQGNEIPHDIFNYNNPNIIVDVSNRTYRDIAELNRKHDICIHVGCHEGCGLGLFESIAVGTPVLTIDNPPNNEIIIDGINGWTINYSVHNLTDNANGITYRSVLNTESLKKKVLEIDKTWNGELMRKSVLNHKMEDSYIDNLVKVLGAISNR